MKQILKSLGQVAAVTLILSAVAWAAMGPRQSNVTLKTDNGPAIATKAHGMSYMHAYISPALGDTSTILSSYGPMSASVTTTIPITSSDYGTALAVPRTVTVRPNGRDADIKAVTATLTGTNMVGQTITQTYLFTVNTPTTIAGTKAFKTLSSLSVPAQDGAGVYVSIGTGDLLGIPFTSAGNPVIDGYVDGTREATFPTVTFNATDIELNTIDFNTAYDGTKDFHALFNAWPFTTTTSASR